VVRVDCAGGIVERAVKAGEGAGETDEHFTEGRVDLRREEMSERREEAREGGDERRSRMFG
jgi:hypothetical protein